MIRFQQLRPWLAVTLVMGSVVLMSHAADPAPDAAVARARKQAQMLDDLYKTAIVLITENYVEEDSDLAAGDALAARIHSLVAAHGLPDGIVHNAGIGWYRPIVEHDEATLRAIIQVNLTAVIQITHALLPAMIERGSGYVVAIGSDLGRRPLANMAAYVASKHGLNGFMHSLLREVKHAGLRVSLIQPGMIDTGFGGHETGRHARGTVLRPDALAKLIVQVVEQPDDLLVDELTVHPPGQGEF